MGREKMLFSFFFSQPLSLRRFPRSAPCAGASRRRAPPPPSSPHTSPRVSRPHPRQPKSPCFRSPSNRRRRSGNPAPPRRARRRRENLASGTTAPRLGRGSTCSPLATVAPGSPSRATDCRARRRSRPHPRGELPPAPCPGSAARRRAPRRAARRTRAARARGAP